MAYIPEINQAQTAANQATKTDSDSGQTLGQQEFLTLLIAQMQNQDPLNPTDSTEWTSQLAQYSQLEQSMNLNTTMEKLLDGQKSSERLAALSLIGREAVVEGSTFKLGEESAEIGYRIDGTASDVQLHIQDSSGHRVSTLFPSDLTSGNHFLTWQGLDENGEHLPAGKYTIVIEARSETGATVGVSPLVRTEVTGVDLDDSGAVLLTDAGDFPLAGVYGIYDKEQQQTEPEEELPSPDEEETENELTSSIQDTITEEVSAAMDGAEII